MLYGENTMDNDLNHLMINPDLQCTDYWTGNVSIGGFVETAIDVCTNTTGNEICVTYYSTKTPCEVYTQSPTNTPTMEPTRDPTPTPSNSPTNAPVWPCPTYWWTNDDMCSPDQCNCKDKPQSCCLNVPLWDNTHDVNRSHDTSFECKLDSDLINDDERINGADAAGYSNGYLLEMRQHNFLIDISPEDYPYTMDIEWQLEFDYISCSYTEGNDTGTECNIHDPAVAGLSVSPLGGKLTVWGEKDVLNATVSFTVSKLTCDEAEEIIANLSNTTTSRRRSRRLLDTSCFNNIAVYGNLVINKATSRGQPTCYDGRIYPMKVPVWFNYAEAFVAPPSDTEELPGWLWWLVTALGALSAMLLVLLYRCWSKSRRAGAALSAKHMEIDAEVEIDENGWQSGLDPSAVGFNPLATGFSANAVGVESESIVPLNGGGGRQDFVYPNVERTVFREQYGPNTGHLRPI